MRCGDFPGSYRPGTDVRLDRLHLLVVATCRDTAVESLRVAIGEDAQDVEQRVHAALNGDGQNLDASDFAWIEPGPALTEAHSLAVAKWWWPRSWTPDEHD